MIQPSTDLIDTTEHRTVCATTRARFVYEGEPVLTRYTPNLLNPDWLFGSLRGLPLCPQFPRPATEEDDDA